MENIIFGHISVAMAMAFVIGIACLFSYSWMTGVNEQDGYTSKRYMKLTPPNITFHLIGSFAVFFVLHEISEVLITNFIPALEGSGTYHWLMSLLCGMFGSVLVAKVFEYVRKKQNLIDRNIEHVHGPDCGHPDELLHNEE